MSGGRGMRLRARISTGNPKEGNPDHKEVSCELDLGEIPGAVTGAHYRQRLHGGTSHGGASPLPRPATSCRNLATSCLRGDAAITAPRDVPHAQHIAADLLAPAHQSIVGGPCIAAYAAPMDRAPSSWRAAPMRGAAGRHDARSASSRYATRHCSARASEHAARQLRRAGMRARWATHASPMSPATACLHGAGITAGGCPHHHEATSVGIRPPDPVVGCTLRPPPPRGGAATAPGSISPRRGECIVRPYGCTGGHDTPRTTTARCTITRRCAPMRGRGDAWRLLQN